MSYTFWEKDAVSFTESESFVSSSQLNQIAVLKLNKTNALDYSNLRLRYKVINNHED